MNKIRNIFLIFICLYYYEANYSYITLNLNESFLNGTFTINSLYENSLYFGVEGQKFILANIKREFDIIKVYQNGYILISRVLNKTLGVDKNNKNNIIFYSKKIFNDKSINPELIIWNLFNIKDNEYLIENQFNNKFIKINGSSFIFDDEFSNNNVSNKICDNKFVFRFLKLYEENQISECEIIENEPVDVFIKYIDLTDKTLKREGIKQIYKDYDNQELRFSLRSIFKYIPWVRKIFIVLPNKKVTFLKPYPEINQRIIYVNDKEFLGFDSANIFAFSFNLYKMEKFGISKNFIYMEDDYFIGQHLDKSDFFYYDKKQKKVLPYLLNTEYWEMNQKKIIGSYEELFTQHKEIKPHSGKGWDFSIMSTNKYFFERYNKTNIINALFTHSAIASNIDDLKEIYYEIQDYKYINETLFSKTRHVLTLNQPHFHNLYLLNIKHRKVHKIPNRYINMEDLSENLTYIPLFVINTCGNDIPSQNDYINARKVMKKRFPIKTEYELNDDNYNDLKISYINISNNLSESVYHKKSKQNNGFPNYLCFIIVLFFISTFLKLKIIIYKNFNHKI